SHCPKQCPAGLSGYDEIVVTFGIILRAKYNVREQTTGSLKHLHRTARSAVGVQSARPGPMNDVLDKVSMEQTLANRSRSAIVPSVRCAGTHIDVRGADRHMRFVAMRRVCGPGLK